MTNPSKKQPRTCAVCSRAENPLNPLRFRKWLDGKVYCDDHTPAKVEELTPASPVSHSVGSPVSSAGSLIVIPCPDCLGQGRATRHPGPTVTRCASCAGYGRVRIPENFLNVYRPKWNKPEPQQPLTEG